jgi:outer membrane protein W
MIMIRRAAVLVFALALHPVVAAAQDTVFTVTAASADVYKGPTTVTPVIGHATRGAVLPVTRNLGSWAKVAWPDAPDGIGYVHLTMGRLTPSKGEPTAPVARAPQATAVQTAAASSAARTTSPAPARQLPRDHQMVVTDSTGATISHMLGVGGGVGSTGSFGAAARAWHNNRIGFQVSFGRDTMTSDVAAGRVTAMQVEPAVLFALFDHVSDYVWIRPYVGSGVSFQHQTLKVSTSDVANQSSENGVGYRLFGGSELTFAGAQRFGLSVEFGYRHAPAPFPGFEPDSMNASLVGHWYVK